MKRYKVRFHLARGDNYMKWQVTDSQQDTKSYFDPNLKSIVMRDCILGNHPKTAMRIHNGENKTVCAWVSCDDLAVVDTIPLSSTMTQYKYNPKKNPYWFTDRDDNVDNKQIKLMMTNKQQVYG